MLHIEQAIALYCGGPGSGRKPGENHFIFVQHPEKGTHFRYSNDRQWNTPGDAAADKYRNHVPLMEELGMPTSGSGYDRVARGYGSADSERKKVYITLDGGPSNAPNSYNPEDVKRELKKQFPGYDIDHPYIPYKKDDY